MINPVTATSSLSMDSQEDLTHTANTRAMHRQADHHLAAAAARPAPESTVTLSAVSQILALKQNGATPDQIAARLHLSVAEVDAELGTTSSNLSSQAPALAALGARH